MFCPEFAIYLFVYRYEEGRYYENKVVVVYAFQTKSLINKMETNALHYDSFHRILGTKGLKR